MNFGIICNMRKIPAIVWLPAVFVLGGLVGYYSPSEELRANEERARKEVSKPRRPDAFGSFAQMVNIPAEAKHPPRIDSAPKAAAETPATQAGKAATNAAPESARDDHSPRRIRRMAPEDLRARIDEAADLWRTRVEVARASAIAKLGLDDAAAQKFNTAIESMNDKLRESIQIVADEIATAGSLTPELGIRLMGDLSQSLAETYDEIGACVATDMRADVSGLQLIEFVDPSMGEPLIAVQDKLVPEGTETQE